MPLVLIRAFRTAQSLNAEDASYHLTRPPAQQGKQKESGEDPEANPGQQAWGVVMVLP